MEANNTESQPIERRSIGRRWRLIAGVSAVALALAVVAFPPTREAPPAPHFVWLTDAEFSALAQPSGPGPWFVSLRTKLEEGVRRRLFLSPPPSRNHSLRKNKHSAASTWTTVEPA